MKKIISVIVAFSAILLTSCSRRERGENLSSTPEVNAVQVNSGSPPGMETEGGAPPLMHLTGPASRSPEGPPEVTSPDFRQSGARRGQLPAPTGRRNQEGGRMVTSPKSLDSYLHHRIYYDIDPQTGEQINHRKVYVGSVGPDDPRKANPKAKVYGKEDAVAMHNGEVEEGGVPEHLATMADDEWAKIKADRLKKGIGQRKPPQTARR